MDILFHATRMPGRFRSLYPFSHFGSLNAALDILQHEYGEPDGNFYGTVYACRAHQQNALEIGDVEPRIIGLYAGLKHGWMRQRPRTPDTLQLEALGRAILEPLHEWKSLGKPREGDAYERLREKEECLESALGSWLMHVGVHCLRYQNTIEDPGHFTFVPVVATFPIFAHPVKPGMSLSRVVEEISSAVRDLPCATGCGS